MCKNIKRKYFRNNIPGEFVIETNMNELNISWE